MTKQKKRPRVGDECWFVEWTYELVWVDGDDTSEFREIDRDNCKTHRRMVSTKEEAEKLARDVYPQTTNCFGFVEYWPATFTAYDEDDAEAFPHAGFWECTADPECVDGDE